MPDICFALPGDPTTRTGGYLYDSHIMAGLKARGFSVQLLGLSERFPVPDDNALAQAETAFSQLPPGLPVVVDGLAFGALPADLVRKLARDRHLVALVHHPLAVETGLDEALRRSLHKTEKQALALADRVVVTGPATARHLVQDYGLSTADIEVILPGTDPAPPAEGGKGVLNLLCVASLTPRKNQLQLLEALASLEARIPWRLTLAGSEQRDGAYAAQVRSALRVLGLEEQVRCVGEVDQERLDSLYHHADIFVLPSLLEGYGMVFAEALARGLPIIAPTSAAIVETLPESCGLFVAPGNAAELRTALEKVLGDGEDLLELQDGARRARNDLPSWDQAVDRFAELLAGRKRQSP